MADKQISELTAGTISSNNDVLMFDDATGVTYKLPYSDLARAILQTSLGAGAGISITQDTSASIFKMDIASTVEGSRWYYGTSQPQNAGNGDYWINTTSGQNLSVYQYNGSAWNDTGMDLKGTDGTNGVNGQDGYSISATTTTITGGHRVTIHSTDPNVPDTYFDVMDGTGGGGGGDPADVAYSVGTAYGMQISREWNEISVPYINDGTANMLHLSRDLARFSDTYDSSGDFWTWLYSSYMPTYGYLNNDNRPDALKIGDYINVNMGALGTGMAFITNIRGGSRSGAYGEIDFALRFAYSNYPTKAYNDTATNNGTGANQNSFRASDIYYFLNSLSGTTPAGTSVNYTNSGVYYYLPSTLKSAIIERKTIAGTRYQSGTQLTENGEPAPTTLGKLWLPSEVEVYGYPVYSDGGKSLAGLDSPMPYFTSQHNWGEMFNTTSDPMLLRDPVKGSSTEVCAITVDQNDYFTCAGKVAANTQCQLLVCFTIGMTNY